MKRRPIVKLSIILTVGLFLRPHYCVSGMICLILALLLPHPLHLLLCGSTLILIVSIRRVLNEIHLLLLIFSLPLPGGTKSLTAT